MHPIDRRSFLKGSLLAAAALSARPATNGAPSAQTRAGAGPGIIDTDVMLFDWPYRRLKYGGDTRALVARLRQYGITQAWAGSYEALLQKNVSGVNARLAEECRRHGDGLLLPFGTVNPVWADWEEDLRRCHEVHKMPGIRIFPGYQYINVADPRFTELLAAAGRRGMIVQIVVDMEDPRVHHPSFVQLAFDADALVAALKAQPKTRVQLVHATNELTGRKRTKVVQETAALFDIGRFEGNGILAQVLGVDQPLGSLAEGRVPLERLLFGSHAPYFPVSTSVMRLFESPLSLPQMQAIMEGNARRLLAPA